MDKEFKKIYERMQKVDIELRAIVDDLLEYEKSLDNETNVKN